MGGHAPAMLCGAILAGTVRITTGGERLELTAASAPATRHAAASRIHSLIGLALACASGPFRQRIGS